jgi:hypothetical protein
LVIHLEDGYQLVQRDRGAEGSTEVDGSGDPLIGILDRILSAEGMGGGDLIPQCPGSDRYLIAQDQQRTQGS